mgnify:CR=1 FL=1
MRELAPLVRAVRAVREQRTVLLNLTRMPPDLAQRTADFVSGGVYAIDGHQQRIGDNVLVFASSSVRLEWLTEQSDAQD